MHKPITSFNDAPEAPVTYTDKTLLLDTKQMEVGQYYWLAYRDEKVFVVKWDDGSIAFYRPHNINSIWVTLGYCLIGFAILYILASYLPK